MIRLQVEWAFLNATGGVKNLTRDCGVTEEHNEISGKEKYQIRCSKTSGMCNLRRL